MDDNLTKSTVFGVMWTGISQFSLQAFRFIVVIILARLLSPEDFGIIGLVAIYIGLINTVNELGLSAAIIQKKKVEEAIESVTDGSRAVDAAAEKEIAKWIKDKDKN